MTQHPLPEAAEQLGRLRAAIGLIQVGKEEAGVARRHKGSCFKQLGTAKLRGSPQVPVAASYSQAELE